MFSQRMVALYMKIRLAVSSNGMKEHRLFHRRYQSMTDSTKHGVIRPYSKLIFADFLKLTGIMQEVALHIIRAMVKGRCQAVLNRQRPWTISSSVISVNGAGCS